jgi:4-hydroxy-tetrahydrodipicolinate synthase
MLKVQTPGLIVAPLTPFTADLKVDEAGLARQIDYIVEDCRATMVVAAGVETQEYTYLSLTERKDLIRRTLDLVDNRVPVMVGISHASFKTAIELAHDAERWGAAAVQLLAPRRPFAGVPTRADLIAYFEAIGRETTLPITLYLNPGPGADVSIPTRLRSPSYLRCSSLKRVPAIWLAWRDSLWKSIAPATPAITPPCRCSWRPCS